MITKLFKRILTFIQSILVLTYIVFEEIVWERFAKPLYRYIKHLRIFVRLEIILKHTNRYIILFLFILPFIIGELLGAVSAVVAIKGFVFLAIVLYVLKLVIAAFAFWLFNIQKEKLLSFVIIKYSYQKIMQFTNWIKSTSVFIAVKDKVAKFKEIIRKMVIKIRMKFNI